MFPRPKEIDTSKIERPMMHLYFRHSNGEYTLIAKDVGEWGENLIWAYIRQDIAKKNPAFKVKEEKIWTDAIGRKCFDPGSPTEMYLVF